MIELFSGDETALRFTPVEMRRVHGLDIHPSRIGLKYSHSDVVIQFENGSTAFLEAVTCILETATYTVKVEPTDISLSVYLSRSEPVKFPCLHMAWSIRKLDATSGMTMSISQYELE